MNSKNSTDPINSMNFTKPDSARIKYRLEPLEYANPDISPNPIRIKVEIKEKDGVTVYGPRDLTVEEQRNQLLWWNGIDNKGDTVKVEKGPFKVELTLKYKEDKEVKDSVDIGIVYVDLVVFNLRNGPLFQRRTREYKILQQ